MAAQANGSSRASKNLKTAEPVTKSVIIAGSGRSGTSWLGAILNSYEKAEYFYEITNYPELDFGHPDLLRVKYPISHRWSWRPDWVGRAERKLLTLRVRWGPDKANASRSLRVFADHRFRKERPDVLLYKIVTLYAFLHRREELAERFDGLLKVVHLIRNPYAQIASELRIDARDPDRSKAHFRRRIEQILKDPSLCSYHDSAHRALRTGWVYQMALVWRVSNEVMLADSYLDKKVVVYEELAREPFAVVSDLFAYLGWELSEQTMGYVKETSDVAPSQAESGHFSLRKNADESLNRWRSELDDETYGVALEAIRDSELMELWSPDELSLCT
jgi:hypothetical protein